MSSNSDFVSISKKMSYALRHRPQDFGLTLDTNGWVSVEQLLNALNRNGSSIDRAGLEQLVRENDKQRFAFNEDKTKIRASQGHSINIDLDLAPKQPPEILFHGTAARFLDSIRKSGLKPQNRQYVHISPDEETALKVGQRHGSPVILKILARQMSKDGFIFFLSANGVWLTESVPVQYIEFPSN